MVGDSSPFPGPQEPPLLWHTERQEKKKREKEGYIDLSKLYKLRDCRKKKEKKWKGGIHCRFDYLSVLLRVCFGFQESVSQQMPVRGSVGR